MAWVNQPTTKVILHAVDRRGAKALMQYHIDGLDLDPAGAAASALTTTTAAMTDVAIVATECSATAVQDSPAAAGSGPFDRVADKLRLEFQADDGSRTTLDLPTLQEALLAADGINLDMTIGATQTNLQVLLDNLITAEGAPLLATTKGFRRRSPNVKQR